MADDIHIDFTRRGKEWESDGEPAKNLVTKFPEGTGPQTVVFHIPPTPTARYVFTADPFWVRLLDKDDNGECPTEFGCKDEFQIVHQGQFVLVIKHLNNRKGRYRYQLNVYDRGSDEYVVIDPIFESGGHGFR